jgi:hypothetical protein
MISWKFTKHIHPKAFGSLKNLPYIQWDVDNASQVAHAEDYIPGYRLIKYSQYALRPFPGEKWVAVALDCAVKMSVSDIPSTSLADLD